MRYQIQCDQDKILLKDLPSKCPNCHKSITPTPLFGHYCEVSELTEILLFCPDNNCKKSFIGYYTYIGENSYSFIGRTSKGTLIGREFSESIKETSTDFIRIYNQSLIAEQEDLNEICGVGYRKSLEFLIKDYEVSNSLNEKEKIENSTLSQCINNFINDSRIQSVAKRASWIGNDETHYVRIWESKNLNDLKKLIDLTIHWIEMEKLTSTFEEEMPDKKNKSS